MVTNLPLEWSACSIFSFHRLMVQPGIFFRSELVIKHFMSKLQRFFTECPEHIISVLSPKQIV